MFGKLFVLIHNEILEKDTTEIVDKAGGRSGFINGAKGVMSIYTTQYLKIYVKTLQQDNQQIDLSNMAEKLEKMVTCPKLLVATNTLPLYFLSHMFIPSN